jgi:excisionase family DNA binding protein
MAKDTPPQDILTVREAAEYLRLSSWSVYKLIRADKVPYQRVGGAIRFSRRALLKWIEQGHVE